MLLDKDNNELDEKDDIMTEVKIFYDELYKTTGHDDKQTKENLRHIKLTLNEQDKQKLNDPITETETTKAIDET